MSSIPNSAMPHAHVAEPEAPAQPNLLSKARATGRGAASVALGALALPLTLGVVATAMVVNRLRKSRPASLGGHSPGQLQGVG